MTDEQKGKSQPRRQLDDMALRLATSRDSDTGGEALFPVTTNVTAEETVIEPDEEADKELDAGV